MTEPTRDEIITLIADETGIAPDRLTDTARLSHDLGVEGEDAWELFGAIAERFGTDIGVIERNFTRYFQPEYVATWQRLPLLIGCAIVGGLTAAALDRGAVIGLAICALLIALAEAIAWLRRTPADAPIPVSVGEVVAAVRAGAWPEPPPL